MRKNNNSVTAIPWIAKSIHKNLPRTILTFPNVRRLSHNIEKVANNAPRPIQIHCNTVGIGKIKPEEILFLDDNQDNIDGASSCGLNTIKVEKGMNLYQEIVSYIDNK